MQSICSVPSGTDQFSHPDDVQSSLFLRIGILNQVKLRLMCQPVDFRDLNKVVYSLSIVFEMERRVLERPWKFDYRLPDVMDRFLRGDL